MYKTLEKSALENSRDKDRQKSKLFTNSVEITINKHNSMRHKYRTLTRAEHTVLIQRNLLQETANLTVE